MRDGDGMRHHAHLRRPCKSLRHCDRQGHSPLASMCGSMVLVCVGRQSRRRFMEIRFTTLVAATAFAVTPALAQDWPARPLTMVVPFAAGGEADVLGRIVG